MAVVSMPLGKKIEAPAIVCPEPWEDPNLSAPVPVLPGRLLGVEVNRGCVFRIRWVVGT